MGGPGLTPPPEVSGAIKKERRTEKRSATHPVNESWSGCTGRRIALFLDGECTNADRAVSRGLEAATAGHRPRQRRFRPSIKNRETGNPQPNDVRINLGGRTRGSAPPHAEASRRSAPATINTSADSSASHTGATPPGAYGFVGVTYAGGREPGTFKGESFGVPKRRKNWMLDLVRNHCGQRIRNYANA